MPHAETLTSWYATALGRKVARTIRQDIRPLNGIVWVGAQQPEVLAVGFARPYLNLWPGAQVTEVTAAELAHTKVEECRFDRVLICHALETQPEAETLLTACAKSLRPDGTLVVMAANRRSAWVWREFSPFAHGRPYSKSQLEDAVAAADLDCLAVTYGLHMPPSQSEWAWQFDHVWQRLIRACMPWVGGVVLLTAHKQVAGVRPLASTAKTMPEKINLNPANAASLTRK